MLDPATRLRQAVVRGNLALTKKILARSPELWLNTDPAKSGWTNLHYASFHGHYLICFHLVSMMHRYVKSYKTQNGNDDFLFCDLDLVSFDNLTVLHMPLAHRHLQTLHFLLQEFCGEKWLNYKGGSLKRTPLHSCCASRFVEGLKLLLEFGANWQLTDANGDTCLHLCFAYGDMACIEALLKYIMVREVEKLRGTLRQEDSPIKGNYAQKSARSMTPSLSQRLTLNLLESADFLRAGSPPMRVRTPTNAPDTASNASGDASASATDVGLAALARIYESRDLLRAHLHGVLTAFENRPNNTGQYATAYAVSFEMEHEYFAAKKKWIDRVVQDEFAPKVALQWDTSLSLFDAGSDAARMQYASPSLSNYHTIASISRASLDSDLADGESIHIDASAPAEDDSAGAITNKISPRDRVASRENFADKSSDHNSKHTGKTPDKPETSPEKIQENADLQLQAKGRKHLRSLPGAADPEVAYPAHDSRPARQHAKSFASNFRGSPLVTRPSTVSLNSLAFPISPLQVEFTSTQSRKSSFASLRLPLKIDKTDRSEKPDLRTDKVDRDRFERLDLDTERPLRSIAGQMVEIQGPLPTVNRNHAHTPTSGSFVSLLTFSPVSQMRRQSLSAAADSHVLSGESSLEGSYKDRGPLNKFPSTNAIRHISSVDSLKRNLSSPTMLANVFRNAESAPAQQPSSANQVLFKLSRRPSTGELPIKVSPTKLLASAPENRETSPIGRVVRTSSGSGSREADDPEKKFLFSVPKSQRSPRPSAFPTLRIRPVPEGRLSLDDEPSPVRNVKSISFARVREE